MNNCVSVFSFISEVLIDVYLLNCRNILCFPIKDEEGELLEHLKGKQYHILSLLGTRHDRFVFIPTEVIGVAQLCNKINGMYFL